MTNDEIKALGALVKIQVTDEEATEFAGNMKNILGYIEQIRAVDVVSNTDVHAQHSIYQSEGLVRDDTNINEPNWHEKFMANVPVQDGGFVKVPRVLGGGSE